MTISIETILVVSLMMAVFAAVATIGSSLFLGAGYERLRHGLETVKKQTAFFAHAIRNLDGRVSAVEKQNGYFFETLGRIERGEDIEITGDMPSEEEVLVMTATIGEDAVTAPPQKPKKAKKSKKQPKANVATEDALHIH